MRGLSLYREAALGYRSAHPGYACCPEFRCTTGCQGTASSRPLTMRFEARSKGRISIRDDQCVVLDHARLSREYYSGRKLIQFASIGSRLEGCHFDNIRIQSAAFGGGRETSEFIECVFDGARMNMGPG